MMKREEIQLVRQKSLNFGCLQRWHLPITPCCGGLGHWPESVMTREGFSYQLILQMDMFVIFMQSSNYLEF